MMGALLEPPTVRPPWVLDDAVATEDGVDVPQHVGGSQVPACPHRKSSSGHKKWAATSPSCEDDTPTHFHTQDLLKEKGRSPPRGFTQKKPLLDQDYQDRGPALHLNFALPVTKSHSQTKGLGNFLTHFQEVPKKPKFPWQR